jgi:hypothetical protein
MDFEADDGLHLGRKRGNWDDCLTVTSNKEPLMEAQTAEVH